MASYIDKNNVKKCLSNQECLNYKFKYIKGKKCTNTCDPPYYKIEQILNNNAIFQILVTVFKIQMIVLMNNTFILIMQIEFVKKNVMNLKSQKGK